jgi:prophage antirepressor-like protein
MTADRNRFDRPDEGLTVGLPAAYRWALESSADPTRAACDWLAAEIVPDARSAGAAIASTTTTLEQLIALKSAFKALRGSAESTVERNLAARLYAGTIAAALLRFDRRISRQRDPSLRAAFAALADDPSFEEPLRDVARAAAMRLRG